MIDSITLRNFQSHKLSTFEFSPGVNVIAGASDQGKSSIIRALKWIAENRPAGDAFRSSFADEDNTEVIVKVSGGKTIKRAKGPKINSYFVADKELKAMGQSVPEEVSAILRLEQVNFQHQMDAPFLLSMGSSKLSQYLNDVAGLDIIDKATSNIKKGILANNQQQRAIEANKSAIIISLDKFKHLDEIDGQLTAVEAIELILSNSKKNVYYLQKYITDIIASENLKRPLDKIVLNSRLPMQKTISIQEKLRESECQEKSLNSVIKSCWLSLKIRDQFPAEARIKYKSIILKTEQLKNIVDDYSILSKQNEAVRLLLLQIMVFQKQKEKSRADYESSIPDKCPICGGPLDRKKM